MDPPCFSLIDMTRELNSQLPPRFGVESSASKMSTESSKILNLSPQIGASNVLDKLCIIVHLADIDAVINKTTILVGIFLEFFEFLRRSKRRSIRRCFGEILDSSSLEL